MKKSIAMAWAKLLESGEIKQAKGQLRNNRNAMCCLGALCNMHAEANPKFAVKQKMKTYYDGNKEILPESVQRWAGFHVDNCNGSLENKKDFQTSKGSFGCLAAANDKGVEFPEIAALIRKHYRKL